jgi:hypothetical protein
MFIVTSQKAIGTSSLPLTEKVWHNNCATGSIDIEFLKGGKLIMGLILLIVLVLFLVGGLPNWGYHSYGFAPSGILGVVLLVVVVLLLTGRL